MLSGSRSALLHKVFWIFIDNLMDKGARKQHYSFNFKWAWIYVGCIPCSGQTWDLRLCVVWGCPRAQSLPCTSFWHQIVVNQDRLEVPCCSHSACGSDINPSAYCLTKAISLGEAQRKCLCCNTINCIFFQEEEDAVHFADRVKAVIAAQAGMSVLPW